MSRPFKEDEVVILPNEDDTSGLGDILAKLFVQTLQDTAKLALLSKIDLSVGLQDIEDLNTSVTIIAKNKRIIIKNGIDNPDVLILSDLDTLLNLANLKILSRDTIQILKSLFNGRLKLKGIFSHLLNFLRFKRLLS